MNNEPVAYVTGLNKFDSKMVDTVLKVGTPLYTHPAKTLTDEEIAKLKAKMSPNSYDDAKNVAIQLTDEEINDFTVRIYNCRTGAEAHKIVLAILRKAQQK